MEPQTRGLIVLFYDPDTRKIWGRGGKFVSLEEFVKYPPTEQRDIVPSENAPSIPDPKEVDPEPGPVLKCIDGREYMCYSDRCYATGRLC